MPLGNVPTVNINADGIVDALIYTRTPVTGQAFIVGQNPMTSALTIQIGLTRRLYVVSPGALTTVSVINTGIATATVTDLGNTTGGSPTTYHYGYVEFTGVANTLGGTAATVTDGVGNILNISLVVDTALTVSPTELSFTGASAPAQTSTIAGGRTPYTVLSSDTSIATVSVAGTTVTVTPVANGACTITVTDGSSGFTSGGLIYGWADNISTTIAVAVGVLGGATSGQLWPIWGN
jgi:hypothetical protein